MESLIIWQVIKRHLVLISLILSVILIVIAALLYPGGSLLDEHSRGFEWSKNFFSNLFAPKAINGAENPGRIWAVAGMVFHSIGYGFFFINMSKKIPLRAWAKILKGIGIANIVLIFLIATPLHDLGVLSIVLTLFGLFTITVFILKSKLHLLKFCCIICLLMYYIFFSFFGLGYLGLAVIMQKVYILSSMLVVLGLEYFTKQEDFKQINLSEQSLEVPNS
jgi:membrane-associated HD superfamily phosphohydrolase